MQPRSLTTSLSVALALLLVACTAGTASTVGDGGLEAGPSDEGGSADSGVTTAVPQTILSAKLVVGTGTAAMCPEAGKSLTIGSFDPPQPVANGATSGGGQVSVGCRVANSASGYDVASSVMLTGATGGSVTFTAAVDSIGNTKMGSLGFTTQGQSFAATSCVVDPAVRPGAGIAAGRYWVGFKCVGAQSPSTQSVCEIDGELRIENCSQ